MVPLRPLGKSNVLVSPVALGCWPIAGVTTVGVTESNSLATLQASLDEGMNFFDTAYAYGIEGESERLIAKALGHRRHEMVIASKGGLHWVGRSQAKDARPARLIQECNECLARLQTDYLDLFYLHAPDPNVPVEVSAEAFVQLLAAGKIKAVGVSNFSVPQMEAFHAVCPITAVQPPYNMLMRGIEADILPWCALQSVAAVVYWPLMKGLLAGQLKRDHVFPPGDGRQKYPMFQGEEWHRNLNLVEQLRTIADEVGCTVAQLVIQWTISQPGITVALCGAHRPNQARENARAMRVRLGPAHMQSIERMLAARGKPESRPAV